MQRVPKAERLVSARKHLRTWLRTHQPDVVVVAGIRRGATLAFKGTVGWARTAAAQAPQVVVEIDDDAPDLGAPEIPGTIVATVSRRGGPDAVTARPADDNVAR